MSVMVSIITGVSIVYSTVCSGADKKINAPRHWPLWGEFAGEFLAQMASNAENVSFWWRHRDMYCIYLPPSAAFALEPSLTILHWTRCYVASLYRAYMAN